MNSIKKIRHCFEAWGVLLFTILCKRVSLRKASLGAGKFTRFVGPFLPVSRVAYRNLSVIFPEMEQSKKNKIIQDMWENFGRVTAEYCKILDFQLEKDIRVQGEQILTTLKNDGKPAIFFTGHLSNFQLVSFVTKQYGLPLVQLYRKANNPKIDKIMEQMQAQVTEKVITKGPKGNRDILKALKGGKHLIILVDQKFNPGVALPFLGKEAMTATTVVALCKRFNCPLVPVRVERIKDIQFKVSFYPPMQLDGEEIEIMKSVNKLIGKWIKERPGQWMWIHKRWIFSS